VGWGRIEHMFDGGEAWVATARTAMSEYAANRRAIEALEATSAVLLARVVEAYEWPAGVPVPDRPDGYGAQHIGGRVFGMDLTSELAVANGSSEAGAAYLISEVADLTTKLPRCWSTVTDGTAPLWLARRVVEACAGLDDDGWALVDEAVAPCLGTVGRHTLARVLRAAVMEADPEGALRHAQRDATDRYVRTRGDEADPLAGYVSARLDRADTIFLDAMVQRIADVLAEQGDAGTLDQRRAKALGVLANPAAAVQLIGVPTTRGMDPVPITEADKAAFVAAAAPLAKAWTPKVQVVVHLSADSIAEAHLLARVVDAGPVLTDQIARITQGCVVRVTPAIHIGGAGVAVDSYEIPQRIRDEVLLRDIHDRFPWSSIESGRLDLDHTIPWEPGRKHQTRPDNLGPLSRRAHRVKTHAGWRLDQPHHGEFIWHTGAGQTIRVDFAGSHRLPTRE